MLRINAIGKTEGIFYCLAMLRHAALLATMFLLAALSAAASSPGDWELVWADEFTSAGLPDASKWDYEVGFIRNNEKQYYTRARLENVRSENGILTIEGRKEPFTGPKKPGTGKPVTGATVTADYTAASINTLHKAQWLYGRVEVRAQLPRGQGVWPAIWMMGVNRETVGWPSCGEIDIMEFVGHDPNRIHGTVHYAGEDKKHKSSGGKMALPAPVSGFHIYALEWFPDRMDIFFDGNKYFTFELDKAGKGPDNPFRKPHYLLINLALGGSWGGKIDDHNLPQKYLIDYVRVYKSKSTPSPAPEKTNHPALNAKD